MRILIIGATSFIGKHLVAAAVAHGHELTTLSRSLRTGRIVGVKKEFLWSFGQPVPQAAYRDIDCAIHLAHDSVNANSARRMIDSVLAIVDQLQSCGVQRQLFFSSYAAGAHTTSRYGKTKFEIERRLSTKKNIVIVRPGLVLGEGGVYGRIRKWARILPLIPLPNGGYGNVPVIEIEKLCELTLNLVMAATPPVEANLFERKQKSLRELVLEAAAETGHHPWILPIPAVVLSGFLKLAAQLRMPLPVSADNLEGYTSNQSAEHLSLFEKVDHI